MSESQIKHEMLVTLKGLAIELGKTPSRDEFAKVFKGANYQIKKLWGSFTVLLQAAGFEERGGPRRRITNEVFLVRDIEKHLETIEKAPVSCKEPTPTVAVISDIHWPWASNRVLDTFLDYVGDEKPEIVAINGDAWDMYSHAKFPRSHNQFTPREEERVSREMNEKFWTEVQARSPKSKCVQMLGNHDIRPIKRVLEAYPEAEDWIKERLKTMFTFPGVETIFDPREEYYINSNTILFHGYRSKLGEHRDYTLMNCINGHTHNPGVVFKKIRGGSLWELNTGFAGDPTGKGLTYTPQKLVQWVGGFGVINKHGPQFVPVE